MYVITQFIYKSQVIQVWIEQTLCMQKLFSKNATLGSLSVIFATIKIPIISQLVWFKPSN